MNKELKNALQEGRLYDYVSNNYTRMSDYELATLVKELTFAVYCKYGEDASREIENLVLEELEEREEFE